MITHWQYNTIVKNLTVDVKKLISENNYKTIDIGASLQFWSYPECKFVADIVRIEKEDVKFFNFNIQDNDEFSFLWDNKYRGNAHHKQIIDVKDDMICIYPKYPFIEVFNESDELLKNNLGKELVIFWENEIPYKFFAQDNIFNSDNELINEFYKQISIN